MNPTPPWTRQDWAILIALIALAAALRFYGLGAVPPGFQFDEAYNAIDAANVMGGERPVFLPANGGREVVYTYLQAALASIFGLRLYTLRLTSALAGITAVALTYVLLRLLLSRSSRRVAGFTALVLATSFWHLHFSHYGIRVILMPVLFSIVFGLYWFASHSGRAWAYLLSGALAGLSVWTNPTGRLVPFVFLAYTAWQMRTQASRTEVWARQRAHGAGSGLGVCLNPIVGLLAAGSAAFAVFLPLGLEFYRHPDLFFGHASGVSVFAERVSGGSPLVALLRHTVSVLGMFSFQGDQAWIHNLAGRPVFDPLMSIPFWLGAGVWVLRLRRRGDPDRDTLALMLIWALVMLLPSIFSDDAPNFSRTLPALPALFVAAGLGLDAVITLGTRLAADRQTPAIRFGSLASVGLIIIVSGGLSAFDYFVRFPARAEAYYAYDVDKLDALAQLQSLSTERQVYLSQLWAEHATLDFLRRGTGIKSLDTSDTLVLPPPGRGAVYAFPAEQRNRAERLAAVWPGTSVETVSDRYGRPLLELVTPGVDALRDWPPGLGPVQPLNMSFAGAPSLLGMQTQGEDLLLFWGAANPTERSLTAMVQLVNRQGRKVAGADKLPGNGSYPTTAWTMGERVIERFHPISDVCSEGGTAQVITAWYDLEADGRRQPRADAPGDTALAGETVVRVSSRPAHQIRPPQALNQALSNGLVLLGYGLEGQALQPGSPLGVQLYLGGEPSGGRQTLALTLQGEDTAGKQTAGLWEGALVPKEAIWRPGEIFCRKLQVRLPADAEAGHYRLDAAVDGQTVAVGEIELQPSTRNFDLPLLNRPVVATLGDTIRLLGADVTALPGPGQPLTVTLGWQPIAAPQASYTVFVHLLDENNQIVAQSDSVPAGGYSTTDWIPGEVVLDNHLLPLPPDLPAGKKYRLVTGMYDPITSLRLPALDDRRQPFAADAVPLGEVQLP